MTGSELIKWIQNNGAEELKFVVQYRDSGGSYYGGEDIAPVFAKVQGSDVPYDDTYDIEYFGFTNPNAVAL